MISEMTITDAFGLPGTPRAFREFTSLKLVQDLEIFQAAARGRGLRGATAALGAVVPLLLKVRLGWLQHRKRPMWEFRGGS